MTKKMDFFLAIRNLDIKTSPAIQKEESQCTILWGYSKTQKIQKLSQCEDKKQNNKETSNCFFCSLLLVFDFYWIII